MKEKRYLVIKDNQGGSFGMERLYTAEEWKEQAIEWAEQDDWENPEEEFSGFDEQGLIGYISEIWDIELAEFKNDKKVIDYLENTYDLYQDSETGHWALELLEELEVV